MSGTPLEIQSDWSLGDLFRARVTTTPQAIAYRQYDSASEHWSDCTWLDVANEVGRWQQALTREGLEPGDKLAIMLRNSRDWVIVDQAAIGLGLITVPLYLDDRPDNIAYILEHAEVSLLVVEGKTQWRRLASVLDRLPSVKTIVSLHALEHEDGNPSDPRLIAASDMLFGLEGDWQTQKLQADSLCTIVYTSGTTGRPKGVMLSHRNLLSNAHAASQCASFGVNDSFLSFLPLSHTLERTGGYLLPIVVGASVAFARSIPQLGEDLVTIRPTVLVSVPRIYESIYAKIQAGLTRKSPLARKLFEWTVRVGWRRFEWQQGRAGWSPGLMLWPLLERIVAKKVLDRVGGRIRFAVCGGAPIPPAIARFFIGLGLPVHHGYGLTEASPVVTVNRPEDNIPESIGTVIPGVEVRLGEQDELLVKGPSVMLGYWKNPEATAASFDSQGWLRTGDKARIDSNGHVFITGRLKDIIVLGNGEKLPPADMEMAIQLHPLFEQALIVGEGRPFLSALLVLNPEAWAAKAAELDVSADSDEDLRSRFVERTLLTIVNGQLGSFPGYARIRRLVLLREPWTIDNGLLTPTLKMKRNRIIKSVEGPLEEVYADYSDV